MKKRRIIRADFRKNRSDRTRRTDWSEHLDAEELADQLVQEERIGKGEHTRKRAIRVSSEGTAEGTHLLDVAREAKPGRALVVQGLVSQVQGQDGRIYHCAVRRLLKTLSTEQRHVVAAGDRVLFRPVETAGAARAEGIIERVEPRHGVIAREVRGRQQVLVANIDQLLIVASAAEPRLKPNLIDRMIVTAEKGGVEPIVCVNKIDLVDPASLQPLAGVYSRMGYRVLFLSATTGHGVERFRRTLTDRSSVVVGQSGVGKSSLLNAAEPSFELVVREVSGQNEKGRHTTTSARLLPLSFGGYVVDTPGIRQFQLWDVIPAEVAGFYRDIRPYVSLCRFDNCTHTHEDGCAVKNAVADGRLDERRYDGYCHLFAGDMESP